MPMPARVTWPTPAYILRLFVLYTAGAVVAGLIAFFVVTAIARPQFAVGMATGIIATISFTLVRRYLRKKSSTSLLYNLLHHPA